MTVNGVQAVRRSSKMKIVKKQEAKQVLKEIILFIPNFVKLLWRLELDPRVPLREKAILAGVIAYVISPIDFIPDFIPFLGYVDDVYLIALVLVAVLNATGEEVIIEHWDGNKNIILVVKSILDTATFFIPHRVEKRLQNKADGK
jgi:uncharacterized membrane protein YkvA (DUF1232 family)